MGALAKGAMQHATKRNINSIIRPVFTLYTKKQPFSTTKIKCVKEIKETKDEKKNITTVEGVVKKSDRADQSVKLDGPGGCCPLCRLDMTLKYTDVLILSQFLRPDGCQLPKQITGLCNYQQKRVANLVHQAQRAGLMPNLRPDLKDGKERTSILHPFK